MTSQHPQTRLIRIARRVAFLGAHLSDRSDGLAALERELARLYNLITAIDGDEPDLTFCCGCHEEIEIDRGQEQWVLDGAKYHATCYSRARASSIEPPTPTRMAPRPASRGDEAK